MVVWDRLGVHRAPEVKALLAAYPKDYFLEELPPYAPDLNPEEGCNSQVKSAMRNAVPNSIDELHALTRRAFIQLGRRSDALRGYFLHAGLSLRGLS